jgi:hypothetical protein
LDINAPDFAAYKKTYPGLFRETAKVAEPEPVKKGKGKKA